MATFTDQQIKDYVSKNFGNLQGADLHRAIANAANEFGVSSNQIGRAFGYSPDAVDNFARQAGTPINSQGTGPAGFSDQQIRDYVNKNYGNLQGTDLYRAIADAANKFGISSSQVGRAFGYTNAEVDNFARNAGRTINAIGPQGSQISDANIRKYVQDLQDTGLSGDKLGRAVYDAAQKYGIDENQYAKAMGLSVDELRGWIQDQGLGALSDPTQEDTMQGAIRGTYEAMSYDPQQVEATNYDPAQVATTDLSAYMNPYTQEVIDRSIADLDRARQGNINNLGFSASQAGAFGGSRHGVAESLTNEAFAKQAGDVAANLRQNAFNTALGQAQYDVGAQNSALQFGATQGMNAQQLNQGAGLQGAQLNMGAANQLANINNLGFTQNRLTANDAFSQGLARDEFGRLISNDAFGQRMEESQFKRSLVGDMFNQGLAQQQLNQQALNAAMGQYQTWAGYPAYGLGLSGTAMPDAVGGTTTGTVNPGLLPAVGWGLSYLK